MTRKAWKIDGLFVLLAWLFLNSPAVAAEWWYSATDSRNLLSIGRTLEAKGDTGKAIDAYQMAVSQVGASKTPALLALERLIEIYGGKSRFASRPKWYAALEDAAFLGSGSALGTLAKLRSESNIRTPRALALVPLYEQGALDDCNSCALAMAHLTETGAIASRGGRKAGDWYLIAARRGVSEAIRKVAMAEIARGRDEAGLTWLRKLGKGSGDVSVAVARDFLEEGGDLAPNPERAMAWFRRGLAADPQAAVKASGAFVAMLDEAERAQILASLRGIADEGDPDAAYLVGVLLAAENPSFVSDEALRYFLVAVRTGRPQAIKATVRIAGFLAPEDPRSQSLMEGLQAAASAGNSDAMLALANFYMVGALAPRDPATGFQWYLKAAETGAPEAQFRAGVAYAQGIGTPVDMASAKRWLTASNTQNYVPAGAYLEALTKGDATPATP